MRLSTININQIDSRLILVIAGLFIMLLPAFAEAGPPRYSQAYTRAAIVSVSRAAGYKAASTAALVHLARHESNWHNWSHSRNGYHGAFQLSAGMAHGRPWSDPHWNTRRAIRYIKGRYGTPTRALAHFHTRGWY